MDKSSDYSSPFSDEAKKLRRNLLVASSVCIFIALTDQLPSSFALWGAKFDAGQQSTVGWFLFYMTAYFYLHFFAVGGVEVAKWIQPFYEGHVTRRKLLEHPGFDETDWMDWMGPDDEQDLNKVQEMAKAEAKFYVRKRLRYLYGLFYLQLILEVFIPLLIGGSGLVMLWRLIINSAI